MTALPAKAALLGDVLGEGDTVRVLVARHPFRATRQEHKAPAGLSVTEIVAHVQAEEGLTAAASGMVASIDGHAIARDRWSRVRPKTGATLVLRAAPADPISAALASLVATISSAAAGVSAFLGGLGIAGKIIGLGLSLAANFVLNALFAARPAELEKQPDKKPSYSLTGSRNQGAPWEAIPVVYGQHRMTPFFAAPPYTETVGEDQYLRCLFCLGYGPREITDIKIGETPLSSFQDYDLEVRQGFPGEPPITLYPSQVIEEALSVDLSSDSDWQRRVTATDVTGISFDVVFPNGVYWLQKEGKRQPLPIHIEARYRVVGTQDWSPAPAILEYIKSSDTVRRSIYIAVAQGQYEFEIKRIDPDEIPGLEKETIVKTAVWTTLRGLRPGQPVTYGKPLALIAVRIRATSQLNGQLDTLNALVTAILPSVNTDALVHTRSPADAFLDVLRGPANARPVPLELIDRERLQQWDAYCAAQGFRYDHVRLSAVSVWDALLDICAAGRAMPLWRDGRWSVIWDDLASDVVQMFTPANSWGFEARVEYREPVHAWRVRFVNREKGYVEDERIVYDDGYGPANATLFEGIEFPGVTDPATIWRHGRFHIAQLRLRPATYTLNVDFEHLVCTRGDRVRVGHDVLQLGLAWGRVTAVDGARNRVTLSESIVLGSASYRLRFRLRDGAQRIRDVDSIVGGEGRVVQLAADGGAMPEVGDLFALGELTTETAVYRILSIEAQGDLSARVTLVDDAPAIGQADRGAIPAFSSPVQAPIDLYHLPPRSVVWQEVFLPQEGGELTAALRLSWLPPARGDVERHEVEFISHSLADGRWRPGPTAITPINTVTIPGLEPNVYGARVRAIFADGRISRWEETEAIDLRSLFLPPPDVTDLRIDALGPASTLRWTPVADPSVTFYEVRFSASGDDRWNLAVPLNERAQPGVQVPTRAGTYLVKAGRANGSRSANSSAVRSSISALDNLNVVEVIEDTTWAGTADRVEVMDGALRLARRALMSTWETLDAVVNLQDGDGDADTIGVETSGYYYVPRLIDLGSMATSRVSAQIEAFGESLTDTMEQWLLLSDVASLDATVPEEWGVELEVSTTDVAPSLAQWSDWRPVTVGDLTARAMQFRLRLKAAQVGSIGDAYAVTTPAVTALRLVIDMPDRVVGLQDVPVPAGGRRIVFDPPFRATPAVATADQDLQPGDTSTITNKGPDGFTIAFRNASGQPVARTVDVVAKGYGSMT
ncbi:hypothetical protein NS365_04530 [Aureimonas ureilytica]|uniref:Tip attachment protein J HDII-ins2 domain-containing protein n=1 Tax=Aureimonas ureilytica TaxID=401562 RepID=A0A175RVI5_9HYPH|nr:host specificity factor TipJ family phage tail protein [Aureimonas ureilytica]KTR07328.1 hypothetical protein NS365_04530 [Aureimonas ureilytica]